MKAAMSTSFSSTWKSPESTQPSSSVYKMSCLQNFKGITRNNLITHSCIFLIFRVSRACAVERFGLQWNHKSNFIMFADLSIYRKLGIEALSFKIHYFSWFCMFYRIGAGKSSLDVLGVGRYVLKHFTFKLLINYLFKKIPVIDNL